MGRYDPINHHRRSIRLKGYDYSQPGAYFVTLLCKERVHYFGEVQNEKMIMNEAGHIVERCWLDLPNHAPDIILGAHAVMPNHFHGILIIADGKKDGESVDETAARAIAAGAIAVGAIHESPQLPADIKTRRRMLLPKLMGRMKMRSAKQINLLNGTPGRHVWQRNYYEHIIRDNLEYQKITTYIRNNPKNWHDVKFYNSPRK